jgi:hypothetical protein
VAGILEDEQENAEPASTEAAVAPARMSGETTAIDAVMPASGAKACRPRGRHSGGGIRERGTGDCGGGSGMTELSSTQLPVEAGVAGRRGIRSSQMLPTIV